jgi:hypothetical protein
MKGISVIDVVRRLGRGAIVSAMLVAFLVAASLAPAEAQGRARYYRYNRNRAAYAQPYYGSNYGYYDPYYTDGNYDPYNRPSKAADVGIVAGTTGGGAMAGGLMGGKKGAVLGAVVGAAVGGAIVYKRHHNYNNNNYYPYPY